MKNPNNCVILCTGCDSICPAGAITHQSIEKTKQVIRELRKKFPLEKEK